MAVAAVTNLMELRNTPTLKYYEMYQIMISLNPDLIHMKQQFVIDLLNLLWSLQLFINLG